jgi:hypothetical protein
MIQSVQSRGESTDGDGAKAVETGVARIHVGRADLARKASDRIQAARSAIVAVQPARSRAGNLDHVGD